MSNVISHKGHSAEPMVGFDPSGAAASGDDGDAHGSGPVDYHQLLLSLGRSAEQDHRIAVHEAGHAICARLLGHEVGGVTVNPDEVRGYEGLCWGAAHEEALPKVAVMHPAFATISAR